jgi:hypothetical protein
MPITHLPSGPVLRIYFARVSSRARFTLVIFRPGHQNMAASKVESRLHSVDSDSSPISSAIVASVVLSGTERSVHTVHSGQSSLPVNPCSAFFSLQNAKQLRFS